MFVNKLLALCLAVGAAVALPLHNVQAAAPNDCKIVSPPEGWPNPIPGYPTGLHIGMNTDWSKQMRPIGDVKAIMLFVDFPNAVAGSGTQAYYDNLVPNAVQFFRTVSYGQFRLTVDAPQRWHRMSRNDRDYGFAYLTPPEVQAVYIDEAMRLADNDVDFSQYQAVYVVPPRNASAMAFSPEWNDYRGVVVHDGKVFKNGVTFGQDAWSWGYKVFNHENGHDMGLPEDYNATGQGPTFAFTGGWDVMGNIGGHAPDLFAWEKWKLGWLTDSQVSCLRGDETTTVTLSPIEQAGGTKMAVVRTGRDTAWVAEVRQRIGVDSGACDKGVLIYKVDSSKTNGGGTIRVFDSHPNTSACNDPFGDAPYDLGSGEVGMFYDAATRTRIELLGTANSGYTVRVTAGSGTPSTTVYFDDFEADRGWTVSGTATAGRWEVGDPETTVFNGSTYQRGDTPSGAKDLVTGAPAGPDAGTHDVDGGVTSARSPAILLPGTGPLTLTFQQYLAHADNSSSADHLRVKVNGSTVFEQLGAASVRAGAWASASADLTAFAGQSVQIVIEAADGAGGSLVEAGIDDVRITAPPQTSTVFEDDFETDKGWTVNASGSDTATAGRWERGIAGETSYQATICQLASTSNALVTGLASGVDCALSDVDSGITSVTSPAIAVPAGQITLAFRYYLAHLNNASTADHLRVKVGGTTVFERTASASNVSAAWQNATVNLSAFAGQTIRLAIEVEDHDTPSLVEAAIDNLTLTWS
ncbi:MAG TPA: hypothetical protein DGT23_25180 [Micromonosporaceae bacterium]|nr:hypothetical protein [Micromonosporaceae bacterium]